MAQTDTDTKIIPGGEKIGEEQAPPVVKYLEQDAHYKQIREELTEAWLKEHTAGTRRSDQYLYAKFTPQDQSHLRLLETDAKAQFEQQYPNETKIYAENEKKRIYKSAEEDPAYQEHERRAQQKANQWIDKYGYRGNEYGTAISQERGDFILFYPEKAKAYAAQGHEGIKSAFEGIEEVERRRKYFESTKGVVVQPSTPPPSAPPPIALSTDHARQLIANAQQATRLGQAAAGKIAGKAFTKPTTAVAKSAVKKGVGKLTKGLAIKAGAAALGIATGVGAAIGVGWWIGNQIAKHKEVGLAVLSWLMIKLAALLQTLFAALGTIIGAIAGGVIGFMVAGPIGAVVGAGIGAAAGNWIANTMQNWFANQGGVGQVAHNLTAGKATMAYNPATGGYGVTYQTSFIDWLTGSGPPGTAIVPSTMVAFPLFVTIGSITFLTFFVAMHILVAFTVPNPVGTESPYPSGPNIPGGPGVPPIPTSYPPPTSTSMNAAIQAAASQACLPAALLAAIMRTESSAYNWSQTTFNQFGGATRWWETAVPGNRNCFDVQTTSGRCQQGYCYDTCTATGLCGGKYGAINCTDQPNGQCSSFPTNLPCPTDTDSSGTNSVARCTPYDVYGVTQFLRTTFHGNGCANREGVLSSSTPSNPIPDPACQGGYAASIVPTHPGPPNRCHAGDMIQAAATKLQGDAGAACPFNAAHWTAQAICQAAKAYCGSCGTVEANPDPSAPCYPWYNRPGDASFASPGCGTNYCDQVYDLYRGTGP